MSIDKPRSHGQAKILDLAREAFEATCNAILRGENPTVARAALDHALDGLGLATRLTTQLGEVPEAAQGPEAEQFKKPPVDQVALQGELLGELFKAEDEGPAAVSAWYQKNRQRIEEIQKPRLRNPLFDRIRRTLT